MLNSFLKLSIAASLLLSTSTGFCEKKDITFEVKSPLNEMPTIRKTREICAQLSAEKPDDTRRLDELGKSIQDISDPMDKAPFMAAFILGNIAVGNQQKAAAARNYLSQRTPDSPYTLVLSFENISAECGYCNGEGIIDISCNRCSGSGKCSLCQGTGKSTITSKEKPCSVCNGTGNCRECQGTGTVKTKCRHCSGRGRQISKDKVFILYSEILAQNKSLLELSRQTEQAIKDNNTATASVRREIENEKTNAAGKEELHFKAYLKALEHLEKALGPEDKPEEELVPEERQEEAGKGDS